MAILRNKVYQNEEKKNKRGSLREKKNQQTIRGLGEFQLGSLPAENNENEANNDAFEANLIIPLPTWPLVLARKMF